MGLFCISVISYSIYQRQIPKKILTIGFELWEKIMVSERSFTGLSLARKHPTFGFNITTSTSNKHSFFFPFLTSTSDLIEDMNCSKQTPNFNRDI